MIPYGRQSISEEDIAQVVAVLRSDFLTQGPMVGQFERQVAQDCRAGHAVAVNSGTSALHIACLALGLGPGDWLWTSPISFVASANCGLYCGASVDFVDIDPATGNMDVSLLEEKLAQAAKQGRLPKILVPVHFAGQPCEMEKIHQLGQRYGFRIIEDASHASGAWYQNTPVGSCTYGDMTVFSFHPVKIVTSAEGGMVLTNDSTLATKLRMLASHGITRDATLLSDHHQGLWYYEQQGLGFNYRLSDVHAALGLSQWTKVSAFVARRNALAGAYDSAFARLGVEVLAQQPNRVNSYHLYVIKMPPAAAALRRQAYDALRAAGVGVNVHYIPIHCQPFYRQLGFKPGDFPQAEQFYVRALTLPLFAALTDEEQNQVIAQVERVLCPG